jgi:hypothetical protein
MALMKRCVLFQEWNTNSFTSARCAGLSGVSSDITCGLTVTV